MKASQNQFKNTKENMTPARGSAFQIIGSQVHATINIPRELMTRNANSRDLTIALLFIAITPYSVASKSKSRSEEKDGEPKD